MKEDMNDKEYQRYIQHRFKRVFLNGEQSEEEESQEESLAPGKRQILQQQMWNSEEKALFIELLQKHGRDWVKIAESLPRKSDKQCRNYFQNYKHKLNLI